MIEGFAYYGSATLNSGFIKAIFEKIQVIQHLLVAFLQLADSFSKDYALVRSFGLATDHGWGKENFDL